LGTGINIFNIDEGMIVRFTQDTAVVDKFSYYYGDVHATCSSDSGELLFHYNYCNIVNKNGTMPGGDSMNIGGYVFENSCVIYEQAANVNSGSLILPFPSQKDKYVLFHIRIGGWTSFVDYFYDKLSYTVVDMALDNGNGMVSEKESLLIKDTLHDNIAAVRHGNGRDWWIVNSHGPDRGLYYFIVSRRRWSAQAFCYSGTSTRKC
jgi:hypothetical protein